MKTDNKKDNAQCTIHGVIERLEKLQKWYAWSGCDNDTPSIDWDEDNEGDWIKVEDVDKLIKELKENVV